MKAKIKYYIEIDVDIETKDNTMDTTVFSLDSKASVLGTILFDTLNGMALRDNINNILKPYEYRANVCNVNSIERRKIII
jgi:hypothetical protein